MRIPSTLVLLFLVGCGIPPSGTKPDGDDDSFHGAGYADAEKHGLDAKFQTLACVDCHGEDLTGTDVAVSCDGCHAADWRTDCTFCHGGTDNVTGAPPEDIDDATSSISFPEHTSHVEGTTHPEWDCVECHTKPVDILSDGHLFYGDTTPAFAELVFGGGLSSAGDYDGVGGCSNLYCHGNGQDGSTGSVSSGATNSCALCHDGAGDLRTGEHEEHLDEGVDCGDCHGATASGNSTIVGPDYHVNGSVDLALPAGMTWSSGSCTGTCHDEDHRSERW